MESPRKECGKTGRAEKDNSGQFNGDSSRVPEGGKPVLGPMGALLHLYFGPNYAIIRTVTETASMRIQDRMRQDRKT